MPLWTLILKPNNKKAQLCEFFGDLLSLVGFIICVVFMCLFFTTFKWTYVAYSLLGLAVCFYGISLLRKH